MSAVPASTASVASATMLPVAYLLGGVCAAALRALCCLCCWGMCARRRRDRDDEEEKQVWVTCPWQRKQARNPSAMPHKHGVAVARTLPGAAAAPGVAVARMVPGGGVVGLSSEKGAQYAQAPAPTIPRGDRCAVWLGYIATVPICDRFREHFS